MNAENTIARQIKEAVEILSGQEAYIPACFNRNQGDPLPSAERLEEMVTLVRSIIFPGYFGNPNVRAETVSHYMGVYVDELFGLLSGQIFAGLCFAGDNKEIFDMPEGRRQARQTASDFITYLPEIRRLLIKDVEAAYLGDPAATDPGEVIFCYPAIRAISNYRIAHRLFDLGVPVIPRIICEMAHSETGIDIHPMAEIGESFTIDHGTGVVIGSTSIIGNNVKLYQGVTLGAKSFPLDDRGNPVKGIPRHPVVEDNVIIYAQATILGRIRVGRGSVIGGNVWVTEDVPPGTKMVQSKARGAAFTDGGGI